MPSHDKKCDLGITVLAQEQNPTHKLVYRDIKTAHLIMGVSLSIFKVISVRLFVVYKFESFPTTNSLKTKINTICSN